MRTFATAPIVVAFALVLGAAPMQAEADEGTQLETHADVRAKLQRELDDYERRGDALTEQVAAIIGKRKQGAEEALESYNDSLAKAKGDLSDLGDDASPTWDALRRKAEKDLEGLGNAVDGLERAIAER